METGSHQFYGHGVDTYMGRRRLSAPCADGVGTRRRSDVPAAAIGNVGNAPHPLHVETSSLGELLDVVVEGSKHLVGRRGAHRREALPSVRRRVRRFRVLAGKSKVVKIGMRVGSFTRPAPPRAQTSRSTGTRQSAGSRRSSPRCQTRWFYPRRRGATPRATQHQTKGTAGRAREARVGVWRGGEAAAPAAALTNRARGRNRGEKATHPRLDRLKLFRGIAKQEHGGVLSFKTDAERHGKKGGQGPQRCLHQA